MARSTSAEVAAALAARNVVTRDFIWIAAETLDTGETVQEGHWSGSGTLVAPVVDPVTGGIQTRTFFGSSTLKSIGDITLVQGITIQTFEFTLSSVDGRVNDFYRSFRLKQAVVQIFRGHFDPETRNLVGPATPRFSGFLDTAPLTTPKANEEGGITVTCTSHTQELTRSNSDTSSDASQKLRSATDNFFQDAAVVGSWQAPWGTTDGTTPSGPAIGTR